MESNLINHCLNLVINNRAFLVKMVIQKVFLIKVIVINKMIKIIKIKKEVYLIIYKDLLYLGTTNQVYLPQVTNKNLYIFFKILIKLILKKKLKIQIHNLLMKLDKT